MKRYVIGEFEGLVEDESGDWMRHEDHLKEMADANHALLLANNSADAFRRVAEARAKQIEALEQQLAQVDIAVELLVTARKVNQSTVNAAMGIAGGLTLPAGSGG